MHVVVVGETEAELELTGEAVGGDDGADVTRWVICCRRAIAYSSAHPSLDPSKEFVSARGVPSKL
eukprot:COSAG06_NODE_39131_length_416_cov_0.640379_1_plen_65_part_00